ncbi:MAG: hypothetical protein MUF72_15105 [Elainella sp. Prado103]|jgi:hypothetical protein|nr:hypothetical protein [Elainella sp. Prado103]
MFVFPMKQQWQRYRELELISDDSTGLIAPRQPIQHLSWLRRLWRIVDLALFRDLEPQAWQSVDSQTGQTCWHLYDPITGQTYHLNSDTEVRQWLEQVFRH